MLMFYHVLLVFVFVVGGFSVLADSSDSTVIEYTEDELFLLNRPLFRNQPLFIGKNEEYIELKNLVVSFTASNSSSQMRTAIVKAIRKQGVLDNFKSQNPKAIVFDIDLDPSKTASRGGKNDKYYYNFRDTVSFFWWSNSPRKEVAEVKYFVYQIKFLNLKNGKEEFLSIVFPYSAIEKVSVGKKRSGLNVKLIKNAEKIVWSSVFVFLNMNDYLVEKRKYSPKAVDALFKGNLSEKVMLSRRYSLLDYKKRTLYSGGHSEKMSCKEILLSN